MKKTTEYDSFTFQYDTSIYGTDWDRIVIRGVVEYLRTPPDPSSWASPEDFYGYNELQGIVIDSIELNDSPVTLMDFDAPLQGELLKALDEYMDERLGL